MLYYLHLLKDYFSPLNVFQYITFRAGGAVLTALLLTAVFGPRLIRFLKEWHITQILRTDGPQSHLAKSGTPTMGGLLILSALLITTALWARLDNRFILWMVFTTVFLGFLGFLDDYLKLVKKHPKGLAAHWKFLGQIFFGVLVMGYLYCSPPNSEYGTVVNVPYFKDLYWNLGFLYVAFGIMVIVGSSNAVNLTDGLDGLAIGCLMISAITYAVFAYLAGHAKFSLYLRIIPVPGAGELVVFLAAMLGAGLGFLWFNAHPAEVFMGDTGSLFLGGSIGMIALFIKQELLLIVVGGIFVVEALSVILQVASYRYRGKKRIFRMAPLHHHFELGGWAEPKVTVRFWIIGIVLSLVALASLKLR